MLFANVGNIKRRPERKGERAICPQCESEVIAVLPIANVRHWRHKSSDCDPWSEPEGEWHLRWKEQFAPSCREVSLRDDGSNEIHRADICCENAGVRTVVELQHSSISEEERLARESFYTRHGRMFWLLHLHDEGSFRGTYFRMSLDSTHPVLHEGKTFYLMRWIGNNTQFIERWKRAKAHVFFDYLGNLFYLARNHRKFGFVVPWPKGTFLVCQLTMEEFLSSVTGSPNPFTEPNS